MLPDIGSNPSTWGSSEIKKNIAKPDVFWNVTPNGKENNRKRHNANGKLEAFQPGVMKNDTNPNHSCNYFYRDIPQKKNSHIFSIKFDPRKMDSKRWSKGGDEVGMLLVSGRCQFSAFLPVSPKEDMEVPKTLICLICVDGFVQSSTRYIMVYPSTGSISKLVFNEKLQELPT